jgi:transposase InsO family protein
VNAAQSNSGEEPEDLLRQEARQARRLEAQAGVLAPAAAQREVGVAERFFRTLKEQIIHGHIYRTVAELRAAVARFVELYNTQWLPEKNGFMSPSATRAAWYARHGMEVAA